MDIEKQLTDDFKEALKAKDKIRKNAIQLLRADILNSKKAKKQELSENEVLDIIAKEIKQKEKAKIEFEKGNRTDLVEQVEQEIEILEEYMPKPLTHAELDQMVKEAVSNYTPFTQEFMGVVIKKIKNQAGARGDGKMIFDLVKSYVVSK